MVPDSHRGPAGPERFPRACRLTSRREFAAVLARGFRTAQKHVIVHFLVNDMPSSRLGTTLPRRVGGAVVRNRVRRRIREAFRRRLRVVVDAHAPADVVVRALPGSGDVPLAEIEEQLTRAIAAWARRSRGRGAGAPGARA